MLHSDLREFIGLLNSRSVDYLIVGAHALAFHARPRYTGDLDILIRDSEANARKLEGVIRDFGFGDTGLSAKDFRGPHRVIQLGISPNRIDLLTTLTGVSFEDAWQARVSTTLDDIRVDVIGREQLIANKRALGRPQDIADLQILEG